MNEPKHAGENATTTHGAAPQAEIGISRETQTMWIVGAILAVGVALFIVMQVGRLADEDRARAEHIAELEREADEAIAEVGNVDFAASPPPRANFGPAAERNMRQMTEIMELSCKQSGYNCAEAKLMRRQYNERNGILP